MKRGDLRQMVAVHLASKGYHEQHHAWHIRRAVCSVMVGTEIVELYLPTKAGKATRAKQLGRIPRRGPARPLPIHAKVDAPYQYGLVEMCAR